MLFVLFYIHTHTHTHFFFFLPVDKTEIFLLFQAFRQKSSGKLLEVTNLVYSFYFYFVLFSCKAKQQKTCLNVAQHLNKGTNAFQHSHNKDLTMVLHQNYLLDDNFSYCKKFKFIEKLIISANTYSDINMHQQLLALHTLYFNLPLKPLSWILIFVLNEG